MKRYLVAIFFGSLLTLSPLSVLLPAKATAVTDDKSVTYKFQNRAVIVGTYGNDTLPGQHGISSITFVDHDVFDGVNNYAAQSGSGVTFCKPSSSQLIGINIAHSVNWGTSQIPAQLNLGIEVAIAAQGSNPATESCSPITSSTKSGGSISIDSSNGAAAAKFEWSDKDITTLPEQTRNATFSSNNKSDYYVNTNNTPSNTFEDPNGLACDESAILVDSGKKQGTLFCFQQSSYGSIVSISGIVGLSSQEKEDFNRASDAGDLPSNGYTLEDITGINISGTYGKNPVGGGGGSSSTSSSSTNSGSGSDNSCANGFSLSWILCSIISGAANLIVGLYNDIIDPILDQPQSSTLLDTSQSYYKVWSSFRIYGDIFLVIALLVVVFGESIGGGIIDAYTAKKILPRLLVSAILINLSIYLVAIALDVTDVLGKGIYSLFMLPFGTTSGVGLTGFTLSGGGLLAALAAGTFGAITIAVTSGFLHFLFVTVLGTAALILFTVMITLVLRVALILGLIFVSPVAFALYVLPNTEQYFRKWWDLLFRALLVYPIVGALFALANITSSTLDHLPIGGAAGSFAQVLGLFGKFAPLVLVPFAFRLSGGAIGAIHNAAHSRIAQPGLQALAGARARRRQTLHERRMAAQDRMGTGRTGRLYRGIATLGSRDGWAPTRAGRARFEAFNRGVLRQAENKKLEAGRAIAFSNDDSTKVLARGLHGRAAISALEGMTNSATGRNYTAEEAQAAISRAEVATGLRAGSDGMQVAAQQHLTSMSATGYAGTVGGHEEQRRDLQRLIGRGLITQEDAASWMKANKSRSDYSANGWQGTNDFIAGRTTAAEHLQAAFKSADPGEILSNHLMGVEAMAAQAPISLTTALASGNQVEIDKAMADIMNIHSALSRVSPKKADEFADTVMGQDLSTLMSIGTPQQAAAEAAAAHAGWTPGMTVRQFGANMQRDEANHTWFHDRSREYTNAAAAITGGPPTVTPPPPPPPPSDRRLKTDITYLQTLDSDIKLYSFRYIWGGPTYVGVMAQDLLESHPEAVITGPDGYYYVDYSLLGIKMIQLEEYLEMENIKT